MDAPGAVFVKKKDRCLREQLALCALFRYNKLGLRLLGALRFPVLVQSQGQVQQHRVSPRQAPLSLAVVPCPLSLVP